jgi:hypothetical protein
MVYSWSAAFGRKFILMMLLQIIVMKKILEFASNNKQLILLAKI